MTVCTHSYHNLEVISRYTEETSDSPDRMLYSLHDFGFRGSTSVESAGIGGAAHLVNFRGSDTLAGIVTARDYYGPADLMAGVSIPASEHSTMTTWYVKIGVTAKLYMTFGLAVVLESECTFISLKFNE